MIKIINKPEFMPWTNNVIKKSYNIVLKKKYKYCTRTHKFGTQIPKYVKEAQAIYQENVNTLWWDSVFKEIEISK